MRRKKEESKNYLDNDLEDRLGPEKVFRKAIKDEMDVDDQTRLYHHMMSARHKFLSNHHRRQSYKKK